MDVRADVWHGVLQALLKDPPSILAVAQTCTALHGLADHEHVWQSVAEACWRHLAAVGRGGYHTYKGLVLDDNRCNAALALAYSSTACTYRFPAPDRFYECRLVQLQWSRTANSLRLYFDARGEVDLRLPLDSSIAVIKLKDGQHAAAAATAEACISSSRAAGGTAAAGPVCSGSFDLDAMGTRLLVHAPDACHTFVQKPGHYKGVLIWHSAKTSELLKALLLHQPADTQAPPLQQHSPVQAARRSEAWEEWADWELEHDQDSEDSDGAAASSSTSSNPAGTRPPVANLLRSCFRHWYRADATRHSGSSSSAGISLSRGQAAAGAAGAQADTAGRSSSEQQQPSIDTGAAQHALVFCYANDLRWYHTMRTPDYSITPLAVARTEPDSQAAADQALAAASRVCPSPQGRPYERRGQITKHLQRTRHDVVPLAKQDEGQLAAAWKRLPGALLQQCGALDQQLQAEGPVQEKLRWAGLPPAVKARGDAWWV